MLNNLSEPSGSDNSPLGVEQLMTLIKEGEVVSYQQVFDSLGVKKNIVSHLDSLSPQDVISLFSTLRSISMAVFRSYTHKKKNKVGTARVFKCVPNSEVYTEISKQQNLVLNIDSDVITVSGISAMPSDLNNVVVKDFSKGTSDDSSAQTMVLNTTQLDYNYKVLTPIESMSYRLIQVKNNLLKKVDRSTDTRPLNSFITVETTSQSPLADIDKGLTKGVIARAYVKRASALDYRYVTIQSPEAFGTPDDLVHSHFPQIRRGCPEAGYNSIINGGLMLSRENALTYRYLNLMDSILPHIRFKTVIYKAQVVHYSRYKKAGYSVCEPQDLQLAISIGLNVLSVQTSVGYYVVVDPLYTFLSPNVVQSDGDMPRAFFEVAISKEHLGVAVYATISVSSQLSTSFPNRKHVPLLDHKPYLMVLPDIFFVDNDIFHFVSDNNQLGIPTVVRKSPSFAGAPERLSVFSYYMVSNIVRNAFVLGFIPDLFPYNVYTFLSQLRDQYATDLSRHKVYEGGGHTNRVVTQLSYMLKAVNVYFYIYGHIFTDTLVYRSSFEHVPKTRFSGVNTPDRLLIYVTRFSDGFKSCGTLVYNKYKLHGDAAWVVKDSTQLNDMPKITQDSAGEYMLSLDSRPIVVSNSLMLVSDLILHGKLEPRVVDGEYPSVLVKTSSESVDSSYKTMLGGLNSFTVDRSNRDEIQNFLNPVKRLPFKNKVKIKNKGYLKGNKIDVTIYRGDKCVKRDSLLSFKETQDLSFSSIGSSVVCDSSTAFSRESHNNSNPTSRWRKVKLKSTN